MDSQEVFAKIRARDAVLVNIMWGDQDVIAHLESARELNPFASYLRYAQHQAATLRVCEKEMESSRSASKDEALVRIRKVITQVESDLCRKI